MRKPGLLSICLDLLLDTASLADMASARQAGLGREGVVGWPASMVINGPPGLGCKPWGLEQSQPGAGVGRGDP